LGSAPDGSDETAGLYIMGTSKNSSRQVAANLTR
jgi:hypothetical protein